jgi:histidyl-tRNA synthetase
MNTLVQPIKGFRDLYPQDKAIQNYLFSVLKKTADRYGFEQYDGPLLENIQIYLNKSSEELINRQTFQVKDRNDQTLVLRPEMTPSLARMVAKASQQLVLPIKLFNIGLRFRYEAPQKGREREFYQADYDVIGSNDILADVECLATAINIFTGLGATEKQFVVNVNSRSVMHNQLQNLGVNSDQMKPLLGIIDHMDKLSEEDFAKEIATLGLTNTEAVKTFLKNPIDPESDPYFAQLFKLLKIYSLDKYVKINPSIVRGLDYYTGLVFEIKPVEGMRRSLLGGGRYDNLVSTYDTSLNIPGVGFATSDVVLWAFAKDHDLIPTVRSKPTDVLVTVFDPSTVEASVQVVQELREKGINAEIYPQSDKKLDKQLKYADKNNIPFVIIIGANEIAKGTVVVKDLKTKEQREIEKEKVGGEMKLLV